MRRGFLLLTLALPLLFVNISSAQSLRLGADVGTVRQMGETWEQWEWGLSLGLNGMINITNNILAGGRLGYNRWNPDDQEFLDVFDDTLIDPTVEGRASVFEIIPFLRFTTGMEDRFVNAFGQLGFGLFIIDQAVTVTGTFGEEVENVVFGPGRENRFGLSFGAGVSLGSARFFTVDIYPVFNYVFLPGSDLRYLQINAGVSFGF